VGEGKARYVVKLAGRDDLIDGRHVMRDEDILFVGILSSGVLDFSQCIFPFALAGGGYTLYLEVKSPGGGANDALGAGNSAVSGGAADSWCLLPSRVWAW
jgi:hypothetical protein